MQTMMSDSSMALSTLVEKKEILAAKLLDHVVEARLVDWQVIRVLAAMRFAFRSTTVAFT